MRICSPLEPGACQTIRLHLLALEPGVHTIDNLTVENTESHHKMTLRYEWYPLKMTHLTFKAGLWQKL
jgi:hypothetical protein